MNRSASPFSLGLSSRFQSLNLTQRGALNAFARGLDYAARVGVGFVLQPILVGGLGSFGYGTWQVLRRLMGYAGPASGRPSQALRWTIANRQAVAADDEKRRYVGSAVVVWFLFLPLLMTLGGIFSWFAPLWVKAPAALVWPVRIAAVVLAADLAVASLGELPRAVLEGENLGYKRMGWSAGLVILGGMIIAAAIYLGWGLVGVAAATVVNTAIVGVFYLQVVRRHVSWFGLLRPAREKVLSFFGLSGWFLAWSVVVQLMRGSDVIILGFFDSVELVTNYTLTKYVPETLINLVGMVVIGVTPGLGGIIGSGDFPKAVRVRAEMMAFSWLVLVGAGATILIWNQQFVGIWVGSEYAAGQLVNLLIVLMVTQLVLFRNDANIIDLTLNLRAKVLIGLVSIAISVSVASALVVVWDAGIVGLCLGFILGQGVLSIAYPLLVGRHLGIRPAHQLRGLLRPALVTVVFFSLAVGLSGYVSVDGWLTLVPAVGLTVVVAALVAFFAGLSAATRRQLLHRVRLVVRKSGKRS